MDKWVTVTKPSSSRQAASREKEKTRQLHRYSPYGASRTKERQLESWKAKKPTEKLLASLVKNGIKPSSSALTNHLLNNLSDESNPITHSDIRQRSDHVSSAATGHQRSEARGNRGQYIQDRSRKLAEQATIENTTCRPMENVRVYINGFLSDTTDIELKRIVIQAGGRAMQTASGSTHIVTSQQLSGSKTHKQLTSKPRNKVHVVRPEWITDSIKAGKRLLEREYAVIKDESTMSLLDMFGSKKR